MKPVYLLARRTTPILLVFCIALTTNTAHSRNRSASGSRKSCRGEEHSSNHCSAKLTTTVSAKRLLEVLGHVRTTFKFRARHATPMPLERVGPGPERFPQPDYYHEYPYRTTCKGKTHQGMKCDRLIRIIATNEALSVRLEILITLLQGENLLSAVRVGIKQHTAGLSVRLGVSVPYTFFRLKHSIADPRRGRIIRTKAMPFSDSQRMRCYGLLEDILTDITSLSR